MLWAAAAQPASMPAAPACPAVPAVVTSLPCLPCPACCAGAWPHLPRGHHPRAGGPHRGVPAGSGGHSDGHTLQPATGCVVCVGVRVGVDVGRSPILALLARACHACCGIAPTQFWGVGLRAVRRSTPAVPAFCCVALLDPLPRPPCRHPAGDILVFLTGQAEIDKAVRQLNEAGECFLLSANPGMVRRGRRRGRHGSAHTGVPAL